VTGENLKFHDPHDSPNTLSHPHEQEIYMAEKNYFKELSKEFPPEAYSVDSSRGFNLTSLKAQYIKERLNEVFTVWGWEFEEQFKPLDDGSMLCHGKLTVKTLDDLPIIREVTAMGFSQKKKNTGDVYKSASTDSLSKCASYIGVANDAFKGLIDPDSISNNAPRKGGVASPKGNTPLASPKQIQYIRDLAAKLKIDREQLVTALAKDFKKAQLSELNIEEAKQVIERMSAKLKG